MRRYITLILLAGCSAPAPKPIDFVPAISVAVGVAEANRGVTPTPAPTPGGVCDNCNGTGKVGDGTVFLPCAACGGDGKIESLVAKLLPGGGETESPGKAAPPAIEDGAISAGGNFRYSRSRRSWIPIDHGNRRYTHNRRSVTAAHLIAEHGHHPDSVAAWTQNEIEIAHANDHAAEVAQRSVRSSGHWEVQKACGRRGCSNVRVWVQD